MRNRTALPLLLLFACVDPADVTTTDQAIVGGQTATTTDFPTLVAIQQNGNVTCTGVLVHTDYVLSAASCFDNTSGIRVRIGDGNLGDGTTQGMTIDASQIIKHPQFSYNDTMWRHDVALIKLAQPVTTVTPTPIGRTAAALGSQITQAGFGTNNNNGGGLGILRSLSTTNIDCAQANDNGMTNANLLCFNAADGNGSCNGDGGAPSFLTSGARTVVGIGSGGTGSSCTSGLDVYTSLAAELGFLDQYVPPPTGTPPTTPPPPPPPNNNNPDGSGGTGPGRNPGTGGTNSGPARAVSCNAGGDAGGLAALAIAIVAVIGRRRRLRR